MGGGRTCRFLTSDEIESELAVTEGPSVSSKPMPRGRRGGCERSAVPLSRPAQTLRSPEASAPLSLLLVGLWWKRPRGPPRDGWGPLPSVVLMD